MGITDPRTRDRAELAGSLCDSVVRVDVPSAVVVDEERVGRKCRNCRAAADLDMAWCAGIRLTGYRVECTKLGFGLRAPRRTCDPGLFRHLFQLLWADASSRLIGRNRFV